MSGLAGTLCAGVASICVLSCAVDAPPKAHSETAPDLASARSTPPSGHDTSRDLTQHFELDPALEVRLWAESPDLFNPTAIDIDARGRVWVTEAVNYRQWDGRNPGMHHDAGDRVVILEDVDGDGVCDTSKVFAQDLDLVAPLGIAVIGSKVVVSCSPSIFVYTDADGDDVPDQRDVLLTGFGGEDHDHGVHSVVVGPDGKWYIAVGNAGPHLVTDKSGRALRSGSLYTGGGRTESDNHPGLVSDDGRVWTGGLVLRVGADGRGLTVLAHNFRNNYEVALNSFGDMFTSDNDDDGNQACRTTWIMEGGNYGYFSADGSRYWTADRRPGQAVQSAHWHQEDPGVMPAGTIHGAGGPTGVVVYEGELLGPKLSGVVLGADAGRNLVYAHRPVAKGAGYELETGVFIASRPRSTNDESARWFRPSDVAVGTDGAVYIADWYDPGVGGHAMGDQQAYGRILRVAPKQRKTTRPKLDLETIEGAVEALKNPAVHVRAQAASALIARGADAEPAVHELWRSDNDVYRARAMWVLAGIAKSDPDLLPLQLKLDSPDPRIRASVLRAMRSTRDLPATPSLATCVDRLREDPAPEVRRELCLSQTWLIPDAPDIGNLARGYDGTDRYYLEALGLAWEARAREGTTDSVHAEAEALLGSFGPDPLAWDRAAQNLAWRLHPKEAIPALALRANAAKLTHEERVQALEALAFIPDRQAAERVLEVALGGPDDVRELAQWWIKHRDLNDWRDYRLAKELGLRGREAAQTRFRSGVMESGARDIEVDVTGATTMWLVVNDGRRDNGWDWADWIHPRLVGPAGEIVLTDIQWRNATSGWGEVNIGMNTEGGPLMIDGVRYDTGIGTHADSEIEYALPPGITKFRATVGIDDGGSSQPGATPDVEFEVYVESAPDRARQSELASVLADANAAQASIDAAADELARDATGGMLLVRLASQGRLTPKAAEAVSRRIFENPDLAVRALASEHFKPPTKDSEEPSTTDAWFAFKGDRVRGQRVFFGDAAQCSTCHTFNGKGGDIGPDLTAIATKYGQSEIVDAILHPSAAIAFGYDTWLVETTDGILITGFILSDGDRVVMKDTSGRRHVIEKSEIASRTKQRLSIMPDNVGLNLQARDLGDLVEFLASKPKAPGKRLAEIELFNGRDLDGWTYFLDDPNMRPADVWSIEDRVLTCKGTPTGYLRTKKDFESFVLTLEWRFDPMRGPGNSGVLLRMTGEDKIWPRSIEAQLHHQNAGDIWNIGEVPMDADPQRTQGRRTLKLKPSNERPLGEWNKYVITLDGGELTLEVNGEVQNRASWCEEVPGKICLQSEGATIQFRNIKLTPIER